MSERSIRVVYGGEVLGFSRAFRAVPRVFSLSLLIYMDLCICLEAIYQSKIGEIVILNFVFVFLLGSNSKNL